MLQQPNTSANFGTLGTLRAQRAEARYENWSRHLDSRYLLCLLFEYAATLGLIDVAYVPPAGARHDFREMWGTDEMSFFSRYDGLIYFRLNSLGAFCLGSTNSYESEPLPVKQVLRVLPNLEVAAIGVELDHCDRLALDSYAEKTSGVVWRLDSSKLLAAMEAGRSIAEIREFLTARSGASLPDTVTRLLEDVSERSDRIRDAGLARLVECVELEVHSPRAEAAREALAPFAELVKSPEHVHTYRLTPLSIWNARSAGLSGAAMIAALRDHAKYPVPDNVVTEVNELAERYGRVVLTKEGDVLVCTCLDHTTAERLSRDKTAGPFLVDRLDATRFRVSPAVRGVLKQALVAAGFPAEDLAGYISGDPLAISFRQRCLSGAAFEVQDYQREAADTFYMAGSERGGSGVIALPCGAGKTIVGIAAMAAVGQTTLVLTTSLTSVKQWKREILEKRSLPIIGRCSSRNKATPIELKSLKGTTRS